MAKKQGGLGRDFYSLLDDNMIESKPEAVTSLRLQVIQPRKDQPRKDFDVSSLQVLADSIREHGVIQPILVRERMEEPGRYEIVAGERRYRAAEMAGLDEVPVVVMSGDDLEVAKVSLIENVQRKDLNPVEEALAYQALIDRFGLTQEQVATQAGKNRSTITNMLRLLELPEEVLALLRDGKLSMGHARALLGLEDASEITPLAEKTVEKEYSVREVERLVRLANQRQEEPEEAPVPDQKTVYMKDLETRLMQQMGRRVRIHQTARKKTVELTYEDEDDLEELLRRIGGDDLFA
ncbi:MAG: ParB/RepB/Spo0J family partition protein [Eubacteriales bacterium]